ncbi:hypothetical protein GCM10010412_101510 [Nonomuraea recticatena]|uniref:Uncharacterized protein n=1 Tax=Nonomuraea recticatena TaxID=46178 RepID=A0ABN3TII6_9ACTN
MNARTMRNKNTHTAGLHLSPLPSESRIEVDGRELLGVRDVRIHAEPNGAPTLELELVTYEIEVDGELQTTITTPAHETLIALGWTPPAGTDA